MDSKPDTFDEKPPQYGDFQSQVEEGGKRRAPRKMSRIDQPRTKSITGSIAGLEQTSSDDYQTSIQKQMDAEAGNAIQYRTCSWQKV